MLGDHHATRACIAEGKDLEKWVGIYVGCYLVIFELHSDFSHSFICLLIISHRPSQSPCVLSVSPLCLQLCQSLAPPKRSMSHQLALELVPQLHHLVPFSLLSTRLLLETSSTSAPAHTSPAPTFRSPRAEPGPSQLPSDHTERRRSFSMAKTCLGELWHMKSACSRMLTRSQNTVCSGRIFAQQGARYPAH